MVGIAIFGLEIREKMNNTILPAHLQKRIEELWGRERTYWEDELYSQEALTNLEYRQELENRFNLDPLGPLPARQPNKLL